MRQIATFFVTEESYSPQKHSVFQSLRNRVVWYVSCYCEEGNLHPLGVYKEMTHMAKNSKNKAAGKHSDHGKELKKLKTIKGQIEGVEKMIEKRRYCTDILGQVRAIRSGLLAVEASVLETHLSNCFIEALQSGKAPEVKKKIHEVVQLFRQSTSKGVRL